MKNIYVVSDEAQFKSLVDQESKTYINRVYFHHTPSFKAFKNQAHADIDCVLVGCVQSKSVKDLSELQFIRENYQQVQVIALFDIEENYHQARVALRGLINTSLESKGQSYTPTTHNERHASLKRADLPDLSVLTSRQLDVLELIRRGESNKQIAKHLGLSDGTIKVHCLSIFRALGVANRTQAAMLANQALQAQGMRTLSNLGR